MFSLPSGLIRFCSFIRGPWAPALLFEMSSDLVCVPAQNGKQSVQPLYVSVCVVRVFLLSMALTYNFTAGNIHCNVYVLGKFQINFVLMYSPMYVLASAACTL